MGSWNPDGTILKGNNIPVISVGESYGKTMEMLSSDLLSKSRIYEFRYDLMKGTKNGLPDFIRSLDENGIRYIFTFRGDQEPAAAIYKTAVAIGAALIDLDISLADFFPELIHKTIISFHGPIQRAEKMIPAMAKHSPFMVKIAPNFQTVEEFVTALPKVMAIRKNLDIPFCFSPVGNIPGMRLIAALYMSDVCYVRFNKPTADGQPTISQYEDFMNAARENRAAQL